MDGVKFLKSRLGLKEPAVFQETNEIHLCRRIEQFRFILFTAHLVLGIIFLVVVVFVRTVPLFL